MTKVTINLYQGLFEAEGSEEFVEQQLEQFRTEMLPAIKKISEKKSPQIQATSSSPDTAKTDGEMLPNLAEQYPSVYHINTSGNIEVLKTMGSKIPEKVRTLALLYLFAKKQTKKDKTASAKEIKAIAIGHGIDDHNFTRTMDYKPFVTSNPGKGSNKIYELTFPGERKAQQILTRLAVNEKNN